MISKMTSPKTINNEERYNSIILLIIQSYYYLLGQKLHSTKSKNSDYLISIRKHGYHFQFQYCDNAEDYYTILQEYQYTILSFVQYID